MQAESSTSSTSQSNSILLSADAALPLFARGVVSLLSIWPALRLATTHGWTSSRNQVQHTSSTASCEDLYPPETPTQKRVRLAEELVDAYYTTYTEKNGQLPEITEIEDFLLDFIEFEYGIALEDESEISVAKDLQAMWQECVKRAKGEFHPEMQEGIIDRFERMSKKAREDDADPSRAMRGTRTGDQDDEDEDDGDNATDEEGMEVDLDVDMDEPQQQWHVQREKDRPIVDEDGFTSVSKRKEKQ